MAVDERARHVLHSRLEEVLGEDEATTLMSHLPPVGWADVATKRDLDSLRNELLASFRGEIIAQTRVLMFGMLTAMFTTASLAFAAARLI
jgi:hypothetical protein